MAISSNHHAMNLRSTQGTFWTLLCTFFLLVLPTYQSAWPGPREGHCSFGFRDNFYVFGGLAQPNATRFSTVALPIAHNKSNTVPWTAVPSNASYNIVDGACEAFPSGHAVFLGFDPNDTQTGPTPGFQTFNLHTQSWVTTATTGSDISQAFRARKGMATVVIDYLIVVFGGQVNGTDTQDTYVLNTSLGIHQWIWQYIPPDKNTPRPSSFVDLSVSRGKVFYIGPESNTNGTKNDVIYSFDPTTLAWEGKVAVLGVDFDRLQVGNYKNARLFMLPTTMNSRALSTVPFQIWELQLWNNVAVNLPNVTHLFQPRIGGSVAVVNHTDLVIYGGNNGTRLGDLYVFDMALRQFIYWNIPPVIFPTTRSTSTPTITPSTLPYTNTGSDNRNLSLILGLTIGLVAILALCCFFIIARYRKRQQNRLIAAAYESNPPGRVLTDSDIAAIAENLAEQSAIPDVHTWRQMLRNLTGRGARNRPDAGADVDTANAVGAAGGGTAGAGAAGISTAEEHNNQDPDLEKGEIPGKRPEDTSSRSSGRSQPMEEQDIGEMDPSPTPTPQSKIRSATDPTPSGEEKTSGHKRSNSRFQEILSGVLPIPAGSSRPVLETLTSGGPSSFAGGAASGSGTDESEDSEPLRFRRSW